MRRVRLESLGTSEPRRGASTLLGTGLLRWGSVRHAVEAGRRCLAASSYHPADVRVLVNAGVHRDGHVCEPANAAYIQHGLGINVEFQGRRTLSFDLVNGGCGMLQAVQVVSALLLAGDADAGMVVASEANSDRSPDPGWKHPASGAAVLLDLAPRAPEGFGAFVFRTDDDKADLYTSVVSLAQKRGRLLLRRSGEVEDAWLAAARPVVDEVLERDGLRREDVGLVVPAQISPAFLKKLPEALGLPAEKVLDVSGALPDTLSTSVFLALAQARKAGRAPKGTRLVLLSFGSGLTTAAATYCC